MSETAPLPVDVSPLFPPVPVAPASTATAEQWRDYIAHVNAYNYAVSLNDARARAAQDQARNLSAEKHAQAQADTATAMNAVAQAQLVAAEAMDKPSPGPAWTRQALTLWCLDRLPELTGLTDLARVDLAMKQADAILSRIPSA